jgi:transcriptional regulator with XRE-family HTH domain
VCQEHFVLMDTLAKSLRRRAEELGLSHAEVARRTGVSERRYGHYVAGRNEPDLATLLRVAEVLQTSPNALLGFDAEAMPTKRRRLTDRLNAAANAMGDRELEIIVIQAEAVAAA